MKYRTMPLIALLLTACSYLPTKGGDDDCDSTQMTRTLTERGRMLLEQHDADSALTVLLNAADYSTGSHDHPANYRLYALISQQYEAKNLSEQQQQFQQRMLVEAQAAGNAQWQSEAYGRMAVTDMVAGLSDRAATHAKTPMSSHGRIRLTIVLRHCSCSARFICNKNVPTLPATIWTSRSSSVLK